MTLSHYRDAFWELGYLVIEDFFDADLMDQLNQIIKNHFSTDTGAGLTTRP